MNTPQAEPLEPPEGAPRRPWVAGLLAALVPGLGHLYAGNPRLAFAASVLRWLPMVVVMSLGALMGWNLYYCLLSGVPYALVYVAQIPWAVVEARRHRQSYTLRWYNRVPVYVGFWIAMVLLSVVAATATRIAAVEAFRVPAGSLRPNIVPGDQVFVSKVGPAVASHDYVDLVVFSHPQNDVDSISRVAGRSGDTVAVRAGRLEVNGVAVAHTSCDSPQMEYVETEAGMEPQRVSANCLVESFPGGKSYTILVSGEAGYQATDFGPQTVPNGHVFVLGDNRDDSYDSRMWGFVPVENIIGEPTVIWWSANTSDGSINFDRLGMRI